MKTVAALMASGRVPGVVESAAPTRVDERNTHNFKRRPGTTARSASLLIVDVL